MGEIAKPQVLTSLMSGAGREKSFKERKKNPALEMRIEEVATSFLPRLYIHCRGKEHQSSKSSLGKPAKLHVQAGASMH
jgi:hypothetical protein